MDTKASMQIEPAATQPAQAPLVPGSQQCGLMTQQPVTNPQPVTQTVQVAPAVTSPSSSPVPMTSAQKSNFKGLGGTLIALGVAVIILNICANIWQADITYLVGAGYWCGIMYILAGSFSVITAKGCKRSMVITTMVISIISAVLSTGIVATTAIGLTFAQFAGSCYKQYYGYDYTNNYYYYYANEELCTASITLNSLMLALGLLAAILCITTAAVTCGASCSGRSISCSQHMCGHQIVRDPSAVMKMTPVMSRTMKGMGSTQIILGVVAVIVNIVGLGVNSYGSEMGSGFWCGVFFILAGIFGILSGVHQQRGYIVAFMTLSILSSVLNIGMIVQASLGLSYYNYECFFYTYIYYDCSDAGMGVSVCLLICSLTEGIISIVSAAFCCKACCCKGSPSENREGIILGQVLVLPDGSRVIVNDSRQNLANRPQQILAYTPQQQGVMVPGLAPSGHQTQTVLYPQLQAQQQPPQYEQPPAYYEGSSTENLVSA